MRSPSVESLPRRLVERLLSDDDGAQGDGDGSGTIEHRMVYTTAALAQLHQFASLGGGRGQRRPALEQQARDMAAAIGPGVTYVRPTPITTPAGQGRESTYAFTDVSQLRISTQPPPPGGVSDPRDRASARKAERSRSRSPTKPRQRRAAHQRAGAELSRRARIGGAAAGQMTMIKTHARRGARATGGRARRHAGPDEQPVRRRLARHAARSGSGSGAQGRNAVPRLQAATTADDAKAVVKGAPGLKINFDREITIEFTPKK